MGPGGNYFGYAERSRGKEAHSDPQRVGHSNDSVAVVPDGLGDSAFIRPQ